MSIFARVKSEEQKNILDYPYLVIENGNYQYVYVKKSDFEYVADFCGVSAYKSKK